MSSRYYESTKDDSSLPKEGYKSRGRIAQVLAQARAEAQNNSNITLKEPSRPYTPASYDTKTSIDIPESYSSQSQNLKYPVNYISKSYKTSSKNSSSSSLGKITSSKSISRDVSPRNKPSSSSSSTDDATATVQLLLYDIRDLLISIDGSLSQLESTSAINLSLRTTQLSSLKKQLISFSSYLDHLSRLIREVNQQSSIPSDANIIVDEAGVLLMRILSSKQTSHAIRSIASRYLIQLQTVMIQRQLSLEAAIALRTGCQALYEVLSADKKPEESIDESSSDTNNIATEVDYLVSFLNLVGARFSSDFQAEAVTASSTAVESSPSIFVVQLEGLTYAIGILRYYSTTDQNRKRLLYGGTIESLSQCLHSMSSCYYQYQRQLKKSSSSTTVSAHLLSLMPKILSQITATFRNFSLDPSGRNLLLTNKVIFPLCQLLLLYKHEPDLQLNILRVLAKLSLLEPFRAQINSKPANIKCLADVIISEAVACQAASSAATVNGKTWPCWQTWPILSRVGFTLGNLTTSNNGNRILIGRDCKCLKPLVTLLQAAVKYLQHNKVDETRRRGIGGSAADDVTHSHYDDEEDEEYEEEAAEDVIAEASNTARRDVLAGSADKSNHAASAGPDEVIDASVKLLRLLANLSIDEDIGKYIASRTEPFLMLLDLLPSAQHEEELLLNIVATATNITYYACHTDDKLSDDLEHALLQLSLKLSECLFHYNDELILESGRALGNLTRLSVVVPSLLSRRVDEALLLLLQHANQEIVSVVSGALVNLTRNPTSRDSLMLLGVETTVDPLIIALRRSSLKNLQLSILICQVLHNLLTNDRPGAVSAAVLVPASNAVEAMFQRQRQNFLRSMPDSLSDTISELVDCARDLETSSYQNNDSIAAEEYAEFTRIGIAILEILTT
jgi:hypothetical protein